MVKCKVLLIATCLLTLIPVQGFSTYRSSIRKYLHISIPTESLKKLSRYNYLIDYYSNFSYFQANVKVSPDFIRALIIAESSCNPKAVSEKKALGLSQILYATGKQAASELAHTDFPFRYVDRSRLLHLRRKDLFDPAINILLTYYLIAKYIAQYNGKLELVLTAWNAGENTESLATGHPALYPETCDFIGKVNGYFIYLLDQY